MQANPSAAKLAECHVVAELLKRGGIPYLPSASTSADALFKTTQGTLLELSLLLPIKRGGKQTRSFSIPAYKPNKKHFILCSEFDYSSNAATWVFPSEVFSAYACHSSGNSMRTLNLNEKRKDLLPNVLHEYLYGFHNRWELITDYNYYRRYLRSPEGFEDLEDILSMLVASERTHVQDESISFSPVSSKSGHEFPD